MKAKRQIRVKKLLRKQYVSKQSTEPYEYKISKVILRLRAENQYISHTRELKKEKKVQKHKSAKWHGNEEHTNISFYHMLQFCGVQAGSYPKTKVKNEIHIPGLKRVI